MKVAVASDHAGYELKEKVKAHLGAAGYEVRDFGTDSDESSDYPDYAAPAARAVADGDVDRAVLVCGSGQGVCMTANSVRGVRAALVWTEELARLSRAHNDANVLCLAGRFLDHEDALRMVDAWFEEEFEGGRHKRRVDKMMDVQEA